ncbi:unnamed protein product [Kluyveromyces dobzhanskii CBS 2104]|uniref:WGS project CCBQ000000000 data, contig 00272 n=1 Tax=Kluyveromyces dobzhanskii CBS 2104 TaxID=1427455 RepID=A0A0A8L896_9SACH|nr:unnamed protein product [Kluyveromyces dobzhanskii CBS 2104]
MTHSLIVSNIPVNVNNATLLKFLISKDIQVTVLPFPDEYHHINDDAKTKTLQLITETGDAKVIAAEIFQDPACLHALEELAKEDEKRQGEHGYALGSSGQVHDATEKQQSTINDEPASGPLSARRISVTII